MIMTKRDMWEEAIRDGIRAAVEDKPAPKQMTTAEDLRATSYEVAATYHAKPLLEGLERLQRMNGSRFTYAAAYTGEVPGVYRVTFNSYYIDADKGAHFKTIDVSHGGDVTVKFNAAETKTFKSGAIINNTFDAVTYIARELAKTGEVPVPADKTPLEKARRTLAPPV